MSKPKILIVDDDADLLEILKDSFEPEGYIVRTAGDGESALKMIEHDPPDVVVLDFRMPGLNGLEVLKRIKRGNPVLPVIMITAYGQELNVSVLTKEGIHTLLTKPLDPNRLRMCVEKALEERNLI
jgi:DNA-binding NtrC family response regulator